MRLLAAALVRGVGFGGAFGIAYYLFGRVSDGPPTVPEIPMTPNEVVTLFLNLAMMALAILSIYIALVAYRAADEGGKQAQKTLDASRTALEVGVEAARAQQRLLEHQQTILKANLAAIESGLTTAMKQQELLVGNLKVTAEQLELARERWSDGRRRLAPRPAFECDR